MAGSDYLSVQYQNITVTFLAYRLHPTCLDCVQQVHSSSSKCFPSGCVSGENVDAIIFDQK